MQVSYLFDPWLVLVSILLEVDLFCTLCLSQHETFLSLLANHMSEVTYKSIETLDYCNGSIRLYFLHIGCRVM